MKSFKGSRIVKFYLYNKIIEMENRFMIFQRLGMMGGGGDKWWCDSIGLAQERFCGNGNSSVTGLQW